MPVPRMVWVTISSTIFTQEFRDFQSAFGFMSRVAIAADKARAPGSQAVQSVSMTNLVDSFVVFSS